MDTQVKAPEPEILEAVVKQQELMIRSLQDTSNASDNRTSTVAMGLLSASVVLFGSVLLIQNGAVGKPFLIPGGIVLSFGWLVSSILTLWAGIPSRVYKPGFTWEALYPFSDLSLGEFLHRIVATQDEKIESNVRAIQRSLRLQRLAMHSAVAFTIIGVTLTTSQYFGLSFGGWLHQCWNSLSATR